MGNKLVSQLQDGRQVCQPAQRSRVTGLSAAYAIFFLHFGHTEIHSWPTRAQSFSPFSSQDGQQVCRPDPTRATNLFSKI
jgi:hypothetical protein